VRITLLPSAYAPAVGGVEELTRRLASHLISSGHEVEVWTHRHPEELPAFEFIQDVVVRRFRMALPAANAGSMVRFGPAATRTVLQMRAATRAFSPDVFHVQCFSTNGVYASVLSRLMNVPLVVTLQGETVMDDNDIYTHSSSLRLGLRAGLKLAKAVTGCSQFTIDDAVVRFGLSPRDAIVIPNGVEPGDSEDLSPLDLPFAEFVLGLGRVVENKGFDLLVDAFHELAERHPPLGLVIGGEGRARPALLAKIHDLGLMDRVNLPGNLSRGQVAWAMSHASAFVLPSRIEPFGIVVLEAMNAGVPVVISARGGAAEIVRDNIDGLVVDPFDSRAMAAALERLLRDTEERRRLAESAKDRVKSYEWTEVTKRYLAIYRNLG
jgi:glycosyltransferase involved in cell wall biosynthesis